ncbi:uncharacterized protein LOC144093870 isoform X1 [Amblyomma americanum]
MSLLTTAKRARGPLRLALALALALLVLILAGMLSSSSERRAHSRRRADSAGGGGGVLLKKQSNAVVRQESLLSKVPPAQKAQARARRSIVQLASMLKCVSGCNPLSYRGYGCFCGYMGDGTPVDHIDSAPVFAEPARPLRPAAVPVRPGVRQLREPLPVPAPEGHLPAQQVRRLPRLPARQEEIAINEPCPSPLGAGCGPIPQWTCAPERARTDAHDVPAAAAAPAALRPGARRNPQEAKGQIWPSATSGTPARCSTAGLAVQEAPARLDSLDSHLVPDVPFGDTRQECRQDATLCWHQENAKDTAGEVGIREVNAIPGN